MSYLWFQYKEAGAYKSVVSFRPYSANRCDLPVTTPPHNKIKNNSFYIAGEEQNHLFTNKI